MGVRYKGSQGQTERTVEVQEEEEGGREVCIKTQSVPRSEHLCYKNQLVNMYREIIAVCSQSTQNT
jgi:hypothetical protein